MSAWFLVRRWVDSKSTSDGLKMVVLRVSENLGLRRDYFQESQAGH
jgi:hypothetical protein